MGKQLQLTTFFKAPASTLQHPHAAEEKSLPAAAAAVENPTIPTCSNKENLDAPGPNDTPAVVETTYRNTLSTCVALDQSSRIPTTADALGLAAAAAAVQPVACTTTDNNLCDYEQQRAARIARNREVLRSLGLEEEANALARDMHAARQPKHPAKRRRAVETAAPAAPVLRRSTRSTAGVGAPENVCRRDDGGRVMEEPDADMAPVVEYATSVAASYACTYAVYADEQRALLDATGVQLLRRRYECRSLSRIYSLDVQGTLLAAGGKGGVVALWGVDWAAPPDDADEDACVMQPLLASKLHGGWVADVQLLGDGVVHAETGDAQRVLLLSASNDGWVALWDAGLVDARGQPKCITRSNAMHSKGIFSLHAHSTAGVLTAGKDGSVALTPLHPVDGIQAPPTRRWDDVHDGYIVKCARWCADDRASAHATTPHVFASCGGDGAVRVVDVRADGSASVLAEAAHGNMDVNCVRWAGGGAPERLLTTGFDHAIRVWDVRRPGTALHTFQGHIGVTRKPSIYQPTFVADGELVVTGGDGSECVSLYSVKTGGVVSRGAVDFGDISTLWGGAHGKLLGAVAGVGIVSMHVG